MSAHLDRLEAAKRALMSANPQLCAAEISAFEAICAEDPPQQALLTSCQQRLRSLATLSLACAEGVADACRGLQDALAAAGQLTTYDATGLRATRETGTALGRRF